MQDTKNRIRINPLLFPLIQDDVRRSLVKVFPFGLLFRDLEEEIVVIAVMHLHRDPDYWKMRITESD